MSCTASSRTGRPFGARRVCAIWEQPRSTFYAARRGGQAVSIEPQKRGPKTSLTDAVLLELIRADLAASPFVGEGHRKVWARLRVRSDVRVGRKRVLRLMRENRLLSPHRARQGVEKKHDGRITTDAPNEMWGTDGARVFTLEDGWGWIFSAVDHHSAECVGVHVCKQGTRFAALEPVAQGLARCFGGAGKDVGRGLALRMDHGTQYLSDHFRNQIKHWGVRPSFAFVEEPQTNGVAERFNRTLKEQAIHGRVFRTLAEVREAVTAFAARYNREWLVEKNGFKSPLQVRLEWNQASSLEKAA